MRRWPTVWGIGLVALFAALGPVLGEYQLYLLTLTLIWALLAVSMNVQLGYLGELNFGQAAFVGIAAYTAALLRMRIGLDYWTAGLGGLALVMAAAAAVGLVTLRVRGPFFVLMMLAFGEIVRLVLANWQDLTNGPLGLRPILPPDPLFGIGFGTKLPFYELALLVLAVCFAATARLIRSKVGFMFEAVREDPLLAEFLGIGVLKYKMLGLVYSAALAGIAGLLLGPFVTVLSPGQFSIFAAVDMVVMVIVGGAGTLVGPLIGAVFLIYVPEALSAAQSVRPIMMGLILILLVIFLPTGAMGALGALRARIRPPRQTASTGALPS